MKKKLILFLTILFININFVYASNSTKITLDTNSLSPGDKIKVTLSVKDLSASINAYQAKIEYDTNIFNQLSSANFTPSSNWDKLVYGNNNFVLERNSLSKSDQDVVSIIFQVKDKVSSSGNTAINIKENIVSGGDNNGDIPLEFSTSDIHIEDGVTETIISIDKSATINVGSSFILTPVINNNKSISWHSNDESICTVSGGTVLGIGVGRTNVIATSSDGKSATSIIVVSKKANEIIDPDPSTDEGDHGTTHVEKTTEEIANPKTGTVKEVAVFGLAIICLFGACYYLKKKYGTTENNIGVYSLLLFMLGTTLLLGRGLNNSFAISGSFSETSITNVKKHIVGTSKMNDISEFDMNKDDKLSVFDISKIRYEINHPTSSDTPSSNIPVSSNKVVTSASQTWDYICNNNPKTYNYGASNVPSNEYCIGEYCTVDCSAFVSWVLLNMGYSDFRGAQNTTESFYRTNWNQKYGWTEIYFDSGKDIRSMLQPGDIVVRTNLQSGSDKSAHVSIVAYIENNNVYVYDSGSNNRIHGGCIPKTSNEFYAGTAGAGLQQGKIIRISD